jgi:hydroxymethylglutaryl-CoA lyase
VATEDLVFLLDGLGIEHGIDLKKVADVSTRFCAEHELVYNSRAGRAIRSGAGD